MILVAGATGFVGSHLVYHLVQAGYSVRALYRNVESFKQVKSVGKFYGKNFPGFHDKIEWVEADVTDFETLSKAFAGVKKVYNCSGFVSFDARNRQKMIEINVLGTRNLVNLSLAKGVEKFVHVSSIAAIGESLDGSPIDEDCQWIRTRHESWYSITKFNAETEVWRGAAEGLKIAIVNPAIIIGPGDWTKGSPSLVATINKGMNFYTEGTVGYVDVRDVCRAMILLMNSEITEERFILSGANLSYRECITMVADRLGKNPPRYEARRPLLEIGWRLAKAKSMISGSQPVLTRNSCRTALKQTSYTSKKIEQKLDFHFTPASETFDFLVNSYIKSQVV